MKGRKVWKWTGKQGRHLHSIYKSASWATLALGCAKGIATLKIFPAISFTKQLERANHKYYSYYTGILGSLAPQGGVQWNAETWGDEF